MRPLVIIPARGGSKGLPGKNIKLLNGKPLIQYTLDEARKLFDDSQICVSTDDLKIVEVLEDLDYKVPFIRPAELSRDNSTSEEVIKHALEWYEARGKMHDVVILLQPTSPLRKAEHIKEARNLYRNDLDMVVSVKITDSNPYYTLKEENNDGFLEPSKRGYFSRRQDCPVVYEVNGAIYIISVKTLKNKALSQFNKNVKYLMSKIDSIDIDDNLDFILCELILKEGKN